MCDMGFINNLCSANVVDASRNDVENNIEMGDLLAHLQSYCK